MNNFYRLQFQEHLNCNYLNDSDDCIYHFRYYQSFFFAVFALRKWQLRERRQFVSNKWKCVIYKFLIKK